MPAGDRAARGVPGEELFRVELGDDGDVALTVVAFSTPAVSWSRLVAPVTRRVQRRITDRYVRALEQPR